MSNYEAVHVFEIRKNAADGDKGQFMRRADYDLPEGSNFNDAAESLLASIAINQMPAGSHDFAPGTRYSLSIPLAPGNNVYAVKIYRHEGADDDTQTQFGPGEPMQILPTDLEPGFPIRNCGLYYVEDAKLRKVPPGTGPDRWEWMNYWLLFGCDTTELIDFFVQRLTPHSKGTDTEEGFANGTLHLEVPVYLNLYDTKTHEPIWVTAHGDGKGPGATGGDDLHTTLHGGIHPDDYLSTLYN